MFLMGLDIGTTGCKASVFTTSGSLVASASREYNVIIPHPTWAEQDAMQVWQLAQQTMQEAYIKSGAKEKIISIGLSCQGEAVVPVDKDYQPLRPVILGMDTRTDAQNEWLRQEFGNAALFQMTGMPIHTVNTLPKLLWIKEHEPEIWHKASKFLLYEDFIIAQMTGRPAISRCMASRTQLYDIHTERWSPEILAAAGLTSERLSQVFPSGSAIGTMLPGLADKLGFCNSPVISTGGHDQACGALGVGLTEPWLCMDSTGTAEVVEVALPAPSLTPELERSDISVYAHVVPGMYLAMTLNHSGGMSLRWYRDQFCQQEIVEAGTTGQDPYDLIFQDAQPEPSSLFLMPHFSGSGTPKFDTRSKAVLAGMTYGTTRLEIARAMLEGLTFELRSNLEVLQNSSIHIQEMRAIGGGARSKYWLQLKADITGVPVVVPRITEAASWGAGILGGIAAGHFSNFQQALDSSLEFVSRYEPDPQRHQAFTERYNLYREIYPAMQSILHRMG